MEKAEDVFIGFINQNKGRMTKARITILKEIYRRHDHFNADDIYLELKKRNENISRASVYRIIPLLLESKLIREINTNSGTKLYEHILGHKHHEHMRCEKCGELIEFKDDIIENDIEKLCKKIGFTHNGHTILINGICKNCRNELKYE